MKAAHVTYLGNLRTENHHLRSGQKFLTDAPVDNNGKGEAFSPTDLVATALADCIITIMGMRADALGVDITGTRLEVDKIMNQEPRRIKEIKVDIYFPDAKISDKHKASLARVVDLCPVAGSLHPDLVQNVTLHWAN